MSVDSALDRLALVVAMSLVACNPRKQASQEVPVDPPEAGPVVVVDAAAPADAAIETDGAAGPRRSTGCGRLRAPGFARDVPIDVDGKRRTYAITVPDGYDASRPYPIVFAFHGDARTGVDVKAAFSFEAVAKGGGIFVYPDGLGQTWHNDDVSDRGLDVRFFDALLAELASSLCVDPDRVFAVGHSRGAYFANQLGCRRPLRGVGIDAGGGPYAIAGEYVKGKFVCEGKPAAIVVHGVRDANVGIGEGKKSREFWRRESGCGQTSAAWGMKPCVLYDGCLEERPVVWCELPTQAHTVWSEAGGVIWSFFTHL